MTREVWRIVKAKRAAEAFSREGARLFGGRWTSPGLAVVYTAESRSLAALEMLVHLNSQALLTEYVIGRVVIQESWIKSVRMEALPSNWREFPALPKIQEVGDRWLRARSSAVLQVPSAIIMGEFNFLLNPAHPDFRRMKTHELRPFVFDKRLK